MIEAPRLYRFLEKLEYWVIVAYAVAVFLPITISWIALIAGMVVFVLKTILRPNQPELTSPLSHALRAPLLVPLLVLAVVLFVSGIVNGGFKEALSSVFSLKSILVYLVAYSSFRRPEIRTAALSTLFIAGAIAGIWGAIQQQLDFHPFEKFKYLQASGFMGNPMAYAGQMEITSCLSLAFLLTGGYKALRINNRTIFAILVACNMAGLFFASERSAWLGVFFAVLTMSALHSFAMFGRIGLLTGIVGLVSWFCVPVVQKRLIPMLTNIKGDVGVQARFVVWEKSLEVFRSHPLLGVGINNFPKLDIPEAIVPGESTHLVHAHNNVLHIMATLGVIGLSSYLYLQFSILLLTVKAWWHKPIEAVDSAAEKRYSLDNAIGLGLLGALVSLTIAGCFEYNFGTGHVRLMHWFVLALLVRQDSVGSDKKDSAA